MHRECGHRRGPVLGDGQGASDPRPGPWAVVEAHSGDTRLFPGTRACLAGPGLGPEAVLWVPELS